MVRQVKKWASASPASSNTRHTDHLPGECPTTAVRTDPVTFRREAPDRVDPVEVPEEMETPVEREPEVRLEVAAMVLEVMEFRRDGVVPWEEEEEARDQGTHRPCSR